MKRDLFIGVLGGLITSALLVILGAVSGHWHLVVERYHSTWQALGMMAFFSVSLAFGLMLIMVSGEGIIWSDEENESESGADEMPIWARILLIVGGVAVSVGVVHKIWVVFTGTGL